MITDDEVSLMSLIDDWFRRVSRDDRDRVLRWATALSNDLAGVKVPVAAEVPPVSPPRPMRFIRRPRKGKHCSLCGSAKHTKPTCPKNDGSIDVVIE